MTSAQAAALAALESLTAPGSEWWYPSDVAGRMTQQSGATVAPATAGRLLATLARAGLVRTDKRLRNIYGQQFVTTYAITR